MAGRDYHTGVVTSAASILWMGLMLAPSDPLPPVPSLRTDLRLNLSVAEPPQPAVERPAATAAPATGIGTGLGPGPGESFDWAQTGKPFHYSLTAGPPPRIVDSVIDQRGPAVPGEPGRFVIPLGGGGISLAVHVSDCPN